MNLKELPLDIENVIKDYYYQIDHSQKMKKVFQEMNRKYSYCYDKDEPFKSYRMKHKGNSIQKSTYCSYRNNLVLIIRYRQSYHIKVIELP